MPFLQVSLEELVRVSGDAQHETAGAEVQQRLVPLQVLFLREAAENLQVILIVTLLIAAEPISTQETNWLSRYRRVQSLDLQNKNGHYYQMTLINSDLMLTSQRKPLLHSHGCCRPAPGTCERTEGRRAGTAPLGDSPARTRWSSSGRCSTPDTESDPPAGCTLTAPHWHPAAGHLLLQQTT